MRNTTEPILDIAAAVQTDAVKPSTIVRANHPRTVRAPSPAAGRGTDSSDYRQPRQAPHPSSPDEFHSSFELRSSPPGASIRIHVSSRRPQTASDIQSCFTLSDSGPRAAEHHPSDLVVIPPDTRRIGHSPRISISEQHFPVQSLNNLRCSETLHPTLRITQMNTNTNTHTHTHTTPGSQLQNILPITTNPLPPPPSIHRAPSTVRHPRPHGDLDPRSAAAYNVSKSDVY
ncbi:hypothetical protein EVG20_g10604 [Dentipellis fragilis]|uniref:Uncharacterized protein n=1 Tax=Dentipellis fragilis TaxID=205917 RepID=A0A4Y9XT27_9AGAM|nr:hypothetical protein EVG20_g10604 [Dentipellis fragilis]